MNIAYRLETMRRRIKSVITLYGIKNCDTMKKARSWLDEREIAYRFHDYKSAGIDRRTLSTWSVVAGWQVLLNRAGATFKKLSEEEKDGLTEPKAIDLMLAKPSLIKRPVLDVDGKLTVGFKPDLYESIFVE